MLKVAITGNIASGKSQVEQIIGKKFPVYDSDKLAHDVLENLTDFYGYDVFTDGKIDRKKLGELVFSNNDLKKKLEEIVHPRVKKRIFELFEQHQNEELIFISVPLLYEAGFESIFDKVILVSVDKNIQLERLIKRNNLTEDDALTRINSQTPQEEKLNRADYIIQNNSDLNSLKEQTEKIIQDGMDKLMEGRTVLVIAHRLSTVKNAKAIMVMSNGEIIERGDHEQLIAQKGEYYQLYTGNLELE